MKALIDIEQFAELRAQMEAAAGRDAVLKQAGLSVPQWINIQRHWLRVLAKEAKNGRSSLALRYATTFGARPAVQSSVATPAEQAVIAAPERGAIAVPARLHAIALSSIERHNAGVREHGKVHAHKADKSDFRETQEPIEPHHAPPMNQSVDETAVAVLDNISRAVLPFSSTSGAVPPPKAAADVTSFDAGVSVDETGMVDIAAVERALREGAVPFDGVVDEPVLAVPETTPPFQPSATEAVDRVGEAEVLPALSGEQLGDQLPLSMDKASPVADQPAVNVDETAFMSPLVFDDDPLPFSSSVAGVVPAPFEREEPDLSGETGFIAALRDEDLIALPFEGSAMPASGPKSSRAAKSGLSINDLTLKQYASLTAEIGRDGHVGSQTRVAIFSRYGVHGEGAFVALKRAWSAHFQEAPADYGLFRAAYDSYSEWL